MFGENELNLRLAVNLNSASRKAERKRWGGPMERQLHKARARGGTYWKFEYFSKGRFSKENAFILPKKSQRVRIWVWKAVPGYFISKLSKVNIRSDIEVSFCEIGRGSSIDACHYRRVAAFDFNFRKEKSQIFQQVNWLNSWNFKVVHVFSLHE